MVMWPVLLVLMSRTMPALPLCIPPVTLHEAPSLSFAGGFDFIVCSRDCRWLPCPSNSPFSPSLPRRQLSQDADPFRFQMLKVGPLFDGRDQRARLVPQCIPQRASEASDDGVPIAQRIQESIHVAMPGVFGVVANPHRQSGRLELVEQFDQRQMGLEEIGLAPQLGIARILRLAERVPGIVAAASCGE